MPFKDFVGELPILFERLALIGKDGNISGGNGRRRVVLSGKNVAACPADFGSEIGKGLDKDRSLDRHVQRASNLSARQGLLAAIFVADFHQAGHFGFGDGDLFASKWSKREIGDTEVSFKWGGDRIHDS